MKGSCFKRMGEEDELNPRRVLKGTFGEVPRVRGRGYAVQEGLRGVHSVG